jgi:AraC-like DNA-binding protein
MVDVFLFLNVAACIILLTGVNKKKNILLGLILFINALQGFSVRAMLNDYPKEISALFFLNFSPLSLLIGPLIYFYTKKKLKPEFQLSAIHLLHIIPALFCFVLIIPYITSPFGEKIQTLLNIYKNAHHIYDIKLLIGQTLQLYLTRPIHILIYVVLSLIFFIRNKSNLNAHLSLFQANVVSKWIKLFLFSFLIMYICNLINTLLIYFNDGLVLNAPLIPSIIAGITLANLSLQIFINPYILYGFTNVRYRSNNSIVAKRYKTDISIEKITESSLNELLEKIKSIETTKKFTEKGYNLSSMALDLDTPKYQLNHYFKEISKESFSEWKNRNRITFAKELIDRGYLNTFTVDTLSQECGYKSRGNFNSAFEEVTKIKLSEYVKIG